MSLSVPVLWTFGSLLGGLALQLLSHRLARPRRARLKGLVADLKADERYGEKDHALIDEAMDEARGNAMTVLLPLLIPTALFVLAAIGIVRRMRSAGGWSPLEALELMRFRDHELKLLHDVTHSRGTVRRDPRFRRLSELAFEIEAFRWPLVSLLTVTISVPVLPFYLLAYGARETMFIMPQLGLLFARGLRLPRPAQAR
jgi:hypothetical protein